MQEQLYNRDFELSIGAQKIPIQHLNPLTKQITTAIRVAFSVEKSDNRDPNRASVDIYNLHESNRKVLQAGSDLVEKSRAKGLIYDWPIVIDAGYAATKATIFSGDIVHAQSRSDGTEWITTIEAEDGGNKYASARISQTFGPGTTVTVVLTALANALGVGLGNSAAHFASGIPAAERGFLAFDHGVALSGKVSTLLDKYVTSAGFVWSIQDGQLQVLAPDEPLIGMTTALAAATGLVGSPEQGEKGLISVRSLLQPSIIPGRLVTLVSNMLKGLYKATRVHHFGDTHGPEWYTEFEGKPSI